MLIEKVDKGFNYRIFNLYVKGTNLFNVLDLKLEEQYILRGRQGTDWRFVFKVKPVKIKSTIAGYGGFWNTLWLYFQELPKKIKDNFYDGGQFSFYGSETFCFFKLYG